MDKLQSEKKTIKSLELHGRKEIENFFKDELEGKSHLKEFVDSLMTKPSGFTLGLPSHYIVDGQEVIVNRRVQEVVIFHS
jgi:hypothetical protein